MSRDGEPPAEERARLEAHVRQLRLEIAELDHHRRRSRDALERAGGRAPAAESEMARVEEGWALSVEDLRRAQMRLKALGAEGDE